MIAMFRSIFHNEGGAVAFYKGLTMNYIKGPISVSVSFLVNDKLKTHMMHRPNPAFT